MRVLTFEYREKLRKIIPAEFFHFQDLISLVPFLFSSQGVAGGKFSEASDDFVNDPIMSWRGVKGKERYKLEMRVRQNIFDDGTKAEGPSDTPPPFSLRDVVRPPLLRGPDVQHPTYSYEKISSFSPSSEEASLPFKELLLIFCEGFFKIDTALATFASYSELLYKKEWQNFLEAVLFSQGTFGYVCSYLPSTPMVISDFLKKRITVALTRARKL